MNAPAQADADPGRGGPSGAADRLVRTLHIDPTSARKLAEAGHAEPEEVRQLSRQALVDAGLDAEEADRLERELHGTSDAPPGAAGDDTTDEERRVAERLLQSVQSGPAGHRRRRPAARSGSAAALKRWVSGDEEAIETWMRTEPPATELATTPTPTTPVPSILAAEAVSTPSEQLTAFPHRPPPPPTAQEELLARERTVLKWLTELLDRVKSEKLDATGLLGELQNLTRELHDERTKRQRLESEVEQVKRGSIAVIKFVRGREATAREEAVRELRSELSALRLQAMRAGGDAPGATAAGGGVDPALQSRLEAREAEASEHEAELLRRIAQLEKSLEESRAEVSQLAERSSLLEGSSEALPEALAKRLAEIEVHDRELAAREAELRSRFEEVRIAAGDRERHKELLKVKEKQLGEWEVQLRTLKQSIEADGRALEQTRRETRELGDAAESARRLQELRDDLARREDELRSREGLLRKRTEEMQSQLEAAGMGATSGGPSADGEGAGGAPKASDGRVSTGVRRLDDLLYGGLPKGSQVILNGPAHTGKELLGRLFVADGLRNGIPAIWILTDKTFSQVREEMTGILSSYPQLEQKGMVRYVDLYSRSVGVQRADPGIKLLQTSDRAVLDQLTNAVNTFASELKANGPTYRLVFESVSTVTAYLDTAATFRFLQPFTGRRKLDGAAVYYNLETGMHSESDLETLEHMVDGSINLKVDQLKTFLSVRGLTDVQSRAWVGYTFTKRAFSLGSFSLDHIR